MDTEVLSEVLMPERSTAVVDIGANPIDGVPPYKQMLEKKLCTVTGFEPQPAALARLLESRGELETYLPYAIADGDERQLYLCKAPGMTSLLKPDQRMLSLFNLFPGFGLVIGTKKVSTHRLDDVEEITELDFLKIDVQGAELLVFQNARTKLSKAVAIQTEMSFLPIYEGQPTFGHIDIELRAQGFVPHCFADIKRWAIAPTVVDHNPRRGINQLLETDMVYVRDFSDPDRLDNEQMKHLALIAHHCYRSFDLAAFCIVQLVKRNAAEKDAVARYYDSLRA